MFRGLINSFREKKRAKEIKKLEESLDISFDRYLTINKLVVSEFNYLFQYILRTAKLDDNTFLERDYFNYILENEKEILQAIAIELNREELKEQKAYNLSYIGAVGNMKNLEQIVTKIVTYQKRLKAMK